MYVQVEYGLAGAGTYVQHCSISLLDVALPRDLRCRDVTAPDDLGVSGLGFFQSGEMTFRNNEDMGRSLRLDVLEGEDMLILLDLFCGNLAADNAAEETVWVIHGGYLRER